MFSLVMGALAATRMDGDRVFEYTDEESEQFFAPYKPAGLTRLTSLPALVLPELQDPGPAYARVGRVVDLRPRLNLRPQVEVTEWQYRFVPDPAFAPIPLELIREHAAELAIERYEGNRTHWAIKPVDLYETLTTIGASTPVAPTVFKLPTHTPRDPDLLAVMMPFAGYDAVYATLKAAAADVGMKCERADDIWQHEHILDDVLSLLWRAGCGGRGLHRQEPERLLRGGHLPHHWTTVGPDHSDHDRRPLRPAVDPGARLPQQRRGPRPAPGAAC